MCGLYKMECVVYIIIFSKDVGKYGKVLYKLIGKRLRNRGKRCCLWKNVVKVRY